MVKKIVSIFLLFVLVVGGIIGLLSSFQTISRNAKLKDAYKDAVKWSEQNAETKTKVDYEKYFKEARANYMFNLSTILFCSALIPLCGFAIYELIRSIRHPMRYAVEGAQQSYADYKAWRDTVRADREAAQRAARRAELERELAELKKTE